MVVLLVGLLNLHQAGAPQDEGTLLLYADGVGHGAVANRDFQTFYGPGTSWLLGGLFLVTGPGIVVERLLWLALECGLLLLVMRVAMRWGPREAAVAGAIAALSLVQLPPYASPWLAAVTLLVASLVVTTSVPGRVGPPWRFALAGLLAALALTFRLDLAPAAALTAIPLVLRRGHLTAWYASGVVVGLVPLAVHVLAASPAAVVQNVVIDAVLRQSAGRHLPIPPPDPATAIHLLVVTLAVAVGVAASVVAHRRAPGTPLTRLLLALTALSAGLLPEMFQRADAVHVYYAACVCVATLPVSISVLVHDRGLRTPRMLAPAASLAILAATFLAPISQGRPVSNDGRQFFVSPAEYSDTTAVIADVDRIARPGERLFVGPVDMRRTNYTATFLYFLLPRLVPSTYFLEMEPLTANRADSRLATDVASADVLVLTSEWDAWNEPNASMRPGSDAPNRAVARLFCLRATDGVYRVYTRCRLIDAATTTDRWSAVLTDAGAGGPLEGERAR